MQKYHREHSILRRFSRWIFVRSILELIIMLVKLRIEKRAHKQKLFVSYVFSVLFSTYYRVSKYNEYLTEYPIWFRLHMSLNLPLFDGNNICVSGECVNLIAVLFTMAKQTSKTTHAHGSSFFCNWIYRLIWLTFYPFVCRHSRQSQLRSVLMEFSMNKNAMEILGE